jgi:hypothetical protein
MPTIESKDFWDLRDLAQLATDCGDILEDDEEDADEKQEATETLAKLSELAGDLGHANNPEDAESVAEALEAAMNSYGPTLVSENYFTDYIREFVSDCGYIPSDIPSFLENNIDWNGVADDLKVDYTCVTFDSEDWYIR